MPYGNYRSANYIKATKPSKENKVKHYYSIATALAANTALYLPFFHIEPRGAGVDVQDDIKNTDKAFGHSVDIGSRVNSIYMRQRMTPTVITPQEFSTGILNLGGDYIDKWLAQLDNTLDHFGAAFTDKTERDLYGDIKYGQTESTDEFVIPPAPFTPLDSPRRDVFSLGQGLQGFNNFRTHEMYGWVPIEQSGLIDVPRSHKRIGARTVWWQFVWNRSDNPINIELFKSFNEYKEV